MKMRSGFVPDKLRGINLTALNAHDLRKNRAFNSRRGEVDVMGRSLEMSMQTPSMLRDGNNRSRMEYEQEYLKNHSSVSILPRDNN